MTNLRSLLKVYIFINLIPGEWIIFSSKILSNQKSNNLLKQKEGKENIFLFLKKQKKKYFNFRIIQKIKKINEKKFIKVFGKRIQFYH